MQLRVLGAHNLESRETRLGSHLIDGVLALDAGGLTRTLTFEEQKRIKAVVLTHRHFDHVRDLLPLGLVLLNTGVTVDVFAIRDTLDFVSTKLLDGALYPDFLHRPAVENPTFRLNVVEFYQEFKVLDYSVVAVPVPHSVPAAGFEVSAGDVRLFYTGDSGEGLSDAWSHVAPNVLLTEVTFGNKNEAMAAKVGHLTPTLLGEALDSFSNVKGTLPRVIICHMNPPWEDAIRDELKSVEARLGVQMCVSHADMIVEL